MRPIKISLTPVTATTTGFNAASLTGAGPFTPTTTVTTDGCGHKVTLTVATSNYSTTTVTLTGTDVDGNAQTEALSGPNNNTVTGTKYFKTLTSISVSASLAGNGMSVGWDQVGVSQTIPLEWRANAAAAMTADISGTINFTVQETYGSPYDTSGPSNNLAWASITALAAKTADTSGSATLGAQAVRFMTNTVTNGATVALYISQPAGYSL